MFCPFDRPDIASSLEEEVEERAHTADDESEWRTLALVSLAISAKRIADTLNAQPFAVQVETV